MKERKSGAQTNEIDVDGADVDNSNANTICKGSDISNEDSGTEVEEEA